MSVYLNNFGSLFTIAKFLVDKMNEFILWVKTGVSASPATPGDVCGSHPWAGPGLDQTLLHFILCLQTCFYYPRTQYCLTIGVSCVCSAQACNLSFAGLLFSWFLYCKYFCALQASSTLVGHAWGPSWLHFTWSVVFVLPRPVTCPLQFKIPDPSPPWVIKLTNQFKTCNQALPVSTAG